MTAPCSLCAKGYPKNALGFHVPALGKVMIPQTPCPHDDTFRTKFMEHMRDAHRYEMSVRTMREICDWVLDNLEKTP